MARSNASSLADNELLDPSEGMLSLADNELLDPSEGMLGDAIAIQFHMPATPISTRQRCARILIVTVTRIARYDSG